MTMTTTTMTMTTTSSTRRYYRSIHGVPGLAVRVGRLLELWGRRAARPVDREQLALHRAAHEHALQALAAREAADTRHLYQPIR